ncbi:MAG: acetyl-CoA carboxylase carboxyltransferase subunit alpha [Candidatus Acidiferrales bacterium]
MTTPAEKRERRKLARERLRRLQERARQRELAAGASASAWASSVPRADDVSDTAPVSPRAAIRDADATGAQKQKLRQSAIDALERDVAELDRLAEPSTTTADDISRIRKEVDELKRDFYANLASWKKVQLARHPQRPYTDDFIRLLFENFSEIHGDRGFADDAAMIAGMALFHGKPCLVVGTQKGRGTKQRVARNFGQSKPEGYRKALRAMRLAAKFGRPIFVFVDTPGAYPGVDGEERGQAEAIAYNIREMARLPVPIIVTITGEGGSGGALAIAVGDRVYMLENSIYSVISPEGCASIMWRDSTKAELAAEALKITAPDLLALKLIDEVVPEPEGGAHNDHEAAVKLLDPVLDRALNDLAALPSQQLIDRRYEKFRSMGQFFA